ncbi:ABC transporter substrate-binding protein [Mesorhizobium sp. M1338]|uniref:ABC transporter substrate-binding protein n=1 Tax=unclassified Mesorhizobium TaxID=325217 RepID=UPI003338D279
MITRRHLLAATGSIGFVLATRQSVFAASSASITYGSTTPIYAISAVALEKGFFKAEGLDMTLTPLDAGSLARQMVAAGQATFGQGDASHPLQLTNRGKPAKMIMATQVVASTANMVVRADLYEQGVTTPDLLANMSKPDGSKPVIAATAIGSGTWMFGSYYFEKRGLDKKVNWIAGGGSKTSLAGLQSKQYDALMTPLTWQLQAERGGFGKTIYDVRADGVWQRDFGGNIPSIVIYALQDTIDRESEMVQAYVNAIYQAMRWVKTAPADEVYGLVAKKYYGGIDPEFAKTELLFDRDTWAYDGTIAPEDYERGAKVWFRKATEIPPTPFEQAVDTRFVAAAKARFG